MTKPIKVWFDKEADLLEVTFDARPGYMRPTADDDVMARIAEDNGEVIGFMVFGVSERHSQKPLDLALDTVGEGSHVLPVSHDGRKKG